MATRKTIAKNVSVTSTAVITTWGTAVFALVASDHDRVVTLRGSNAALDFEVAVTRRPSGRSWSRVYLEDHPFILCAKQDLLIRARLRVAGGGQQGLTQQIGIIAWPVKV